MNKNLRVMFGKQITNNFRPFGNEYLLIITVFFLA